MATGTIVSVWQDNQNTYAAVLVAEGGARGNVEYIGSVPQMGDLAAYGFGGQTWSQLTAANKKAALQAAIKAARDAALLATSAVGGISGTVTL